MDTNGPTRFQELHLSFSENSFAYQLWLHATAIQTSWNGVKPRLGYLQEVVVEKIHQAANELNSCQWLADLQKPDFEAATDSWRTIFLDSLKVCCKLLGDKHPITLGFRQIQTVWDQVQPQRPDHIKDLGRQLHVIGAKMHSVLVHLLKEGETIVQDSLEPTRILHLSNTDFRDESITQMLSNGYKNVQESLKRHNEKLAPYFGAKDLGVISNSFIWNGAIRERQSSWWPESGLHTKTALQPPALKKHPSTSNLSEKFGHTSGADALTILENSPSLVTDQTMSTLHQETQTIQSLSSVELPPVEAVTPNASDKAPALRKRADSAYTVNTSVPPAIPRRSSRRRSDQPVDISAPSSPSTMAEPASPSSPIRAMMDWPSTTRQSRLSGSTCDTQSMRGSLDGRSPGVVTGYLPSIHEYTIRTRQTSKDRHSSVGNISHFRESLEIETCGLK